MFLISNVRVLIVATSKYNQSSTQIIAAFREALLQKFANILVSSDGQMKLIASENRYDTHNQ